jgi:hypothetical protein
MEYVFLFGEVEMEKTADEEQVLAGLNSVPQETEAGRCVFKIRSYCATCNPMRLSQTR